MTGGWRPKDEIAALAAFRLVLCQMLRFTILDALVEGRHVALDVRLLLEPRLGVGVGEVCGVVRDGGFGVFVVDDGTGFRHVLCCVRLLLEVILFVNVLNDAFVLALHVLYLLLQVLEL